MALFLFGIIEMVINMIKKVPEHKITKDFLKGYKRHQVTEKVLFLNNGVLEEKKDAFTEEWEQNKLEMVSMYLKKHAKKGCVYAAYSGKHVIGFASIESHLFGDYINMSYLHTDERYRGEGIGRELIYFIGLEAIKLGGKKLYISAHPAVDTQKFYFSVGCELAENVNMKLHSIEPLDIQLELKLDYSILLKLVKLYLAKEKKSATYFGRIASRFYQYLPIDQDAFLDVIKSFLSDGYIGTYSVATLWLKRRKSVLVPELIDYYDDLLHTVVKGWGAVDQICYRALNPVITSGDLHSYLIKWSDSDNKDVRRASLVSMIRSSGKLTLDYDYELMINLVDKLKNDEDYHVKKAVGWVLKCAYPTYNKKIELYLRENVKNLDRMIYRYALEHVEEPLRSELINLR